MTRARGGGGGGGEKRGGGRFQTKKALISQQQQQQQLAQQQQQQQHLPPPNAFVQHHTTTSQDGTSFSAVTYVATLNILLNTLRPDDAISWPMRLPRFMWEATVLTVASVVNKNRTTVEPATYLFLAMLLLSTAITDLLFWAPLFGAFSSFETCTGGWWFTGRSRVCTTDYAKGYGRIVVVLQCMITGFTYMIHAIHAMGCFTSQRDAQAARRHLQMMQQWQEQQQQQQPCVSSSSTNTPWI